jgi:hypothetical protein
MYLSYIYIQLSGGHLPVPGHALQERIYLRMFDLQLYQLWAYGTLALGGLDPRLRDQHLCAIGLPLSSRYLKLAGTRSAVRSTVHMTGKTVLGTKYFTYVDSVIIREDDVLQGGMHSMMLWLFLCNSAFALFRFE